MVRQAVADLVFRGDALADLADVLLRDVLGLTEGVVVCDWDTDFLDVAVVQILDVVLWDDEPVFVVETDTELLSDTDILDDPDSLAL